MTEQMIVEAVKSVGGGTMASAPVNPADMPPSPEAVSRFQSVMDADPIPFASEASAAWRSAQVNHQGILHRIRALSDLRETHSPSMGNLIELLKTETNFKELAHMMVGSDKSTVSRAGRQAGYPGRVEVQVQSPSAGRILSSVGDSSFS